MDLGRYRPNLCYLVRGPLVRGPFGNITLMSSFFYCYFMFTLKAYGPFKSTDGAVSLLSLSIPPPPAFEKIVINYT